VQAEKGQDRDDDDDQAHEINQTVHICLPTAFVYPLERHGNASTCEKLQFPAAANRAGTLRCLCAAGSCAGNGQQMRLVSLYGFARRIEDLVHFVANKDHDDGDPNPRHEANSGA
jgi:hypothetical protein